VIGSARARFQGAQAHSRQTELESLSGKEDVRSKARRAFLKARAVRKMSMTITDISAFNASLNTHAEVDEPEPEPEPEPELEPQPQPQPQPEQVQAAPTAAAAEAEAEAEAEVSPLLDDPNLSEGFLGPSSIEEQGITLSAKLPVAVAVADASGSGGACAALEALLDLPADAHTQAMQAVEAERDTLMSERDAALSARDASVSERDAERDAALSEIAELKARLAAFEGTP
jgi:hypothetical protein